MNTYIFNKEKSEIVLDMPEPDDDDFETYSLPICFDPYEEQKELYGRQMKIEKDTQAYNSRPRYPVSKELSDSWEDGKKVVEGKDFEIKLCSCKIGDDCPYENGKWISPCKTAIVK